MDLTRNAFAACAQSSPLSPQSTVRGALGIEAPDGARLIRNIIAAVIPLTCGRDIGHRWEILQSRT